MFRPIACALVLCAATVSALAAGAIDPAKFRLTPVLLDRMDAVQNDLKAVSKGDGEKDADVESIEELARELQADPRIRAALAKHKISSTEYATGVFAALHAGMYRATESAANKKQQAAALASFTPEQRANIELLRGRKK
ncbi:hypothetical protein [Paenacidovorax monticola]|uniref:Spy/CpxP family protein refolding chaperone n=1 Tax=Paenacidovorax monticola TaxID=1926868 RepID=A0A7H0HHG8_9BURK|nr:hypothetical protein [Paenacidovorax monticola]QNP59984.1 hypothetical protein H9L24_03265 [Paenacidovorax monticola]